MSDELAEVKKIVVKIGDKEFEFSMEEAKALQLLLNGLLNDKQTIYAPITIQPIVYPYYHPPVPINPQPYRQPWESPWFVTRQTTDDYLYLYGYRD
jgi:hypothetical protein